jgi:molybdopterin synthase sulfur carrier subunit
MPLTVKFIGALRHISGKTQLIVDFHESISLKELIAKLSQDLPLLEKTFSDQQLDSKSNSLILVNGREISVLNGYETKLTEGDEIVFIPVAHGG